MRKWSRNDACWCGSKKKYKKCHLEYDENLDNQLIEFQKQGYPIPSWDLIKTPKDIEGIKKSGQLTNKILTLLEDFIKPGITTNQINDFVHEYTIANNAIPAPLNYRGYPKSTCTSINEVICHGIPDETILKEGDIINVDVTCILDGYYGDSNKMYAVGKISSKAQKLLDVTQECLNRGIASVKPFVPINVIGNAIEPYANAQGFSVVRDYGGHGIGKSFHEEPFIYHFKRSQKEMILIPGLVFTIEPMINEGRHESKLQPNKWTAVTIDHKLSAQYEHTIAVTQDGVEILT